MEFHEIANLFPLMEGADFDALVAGIKEQGLLEGYEIRTFEGKILDGRNRFRACTVAGVPPKFKAWRGDDPYKFVAAMNLTRRNMTFEQRVFVAEAMATMKQGARTDLMPRGIGSDTSIPTAAKLLNVSRQSVHRARVVKNAGDEQLVADVKSGKVPLRKAAETVRVPNPRKRNPNARRMTHVRDKAPRDGMKLARAAAGKLNEIRNDDLEKGQAYTFMRRWLDAHET